MIDVFQIPEGSNIEISDTPEGRCYELNDPPVGIIGSAFTAFLLVFLVIGVCGWAIGCVSVGKDVLNGRTNGEIGAGVIWLTGWFLGGMFIICLLYLFLRTEYPEKNHSCC